ncbi:ferritin, partial [Mycobacteroides abscessus subsp. massiliense]
RELARPVSPDPTAPTAAGGAL